MTTAEWLLRRLMSDRRRPVRIAGGLLKGMVMHVHPRSEHRHVKGDAELDVQVPLPALVMPGMCAYNLGANYGFFTLALARLVGPSGSIVAFEPNPSVVTRLRENIAANRLMQVVVEPVAVSDVVGTVDLALAGDFESRVVSEPTGDVIPVASTTLDAYVASGARAPNAIVMDVEDCEGRALRGARATLRAHRPVVIVEIHSAAAARDVMAELAQVDYALAELPSFRRVRASGEIRPRGHYCAAPETALPSDPQPVPETVAAALAYLAQATAGRDSP